MSIFCVILNIDTINLFLLNKMQKFFNLVDSSGEEESGSDNEPIKIQNNVISSEEGSGDDNENPITLIQPHEKSDDDDSPIAENEKEESSSSSSSSSEDDDDD